MANCIDTTLVVIDTWVLAFLADTCKCVWAVTVHCTLWLADDIGVTLETRRTCAYTPVTRWSGKGILTTWIGVTWIGGHRFHWWWSVTLDQCIANVAR